MNLNLYIYKTKTHDNGPPILKQNDDKMIGPSSGELVIWRNPPVSLREPVIQYYITRSRTKTSEKVTN